MLDASLRIDNDQELHYERINFLTQFFTRFILLPSFNLLPRRLGTILFKKSSLTAAEIHKLAKTSNALEFLYNFDGKINFTNSFLDGAFTYFWQHNIVNAKAVRNRIKLAKRELKSTIREIYKSKSRVINIFSLASGSARAVIEAIADLKKENIIVNAKLLDLSPEAIKNSKKIALENEVYDMITWCNDKVSNFLVYCRDWQPDIVEMIGFLDYLNQDKAINLSRNIYNVLPNGGVFITCNIKDNYEHKFISKTIEWDMIYRNEKELEDVLISGGFKPDKCKLIYEPNIIHGLAIGKK